MKFCPAVDVKLIDDVIAHLTDNLPECSISMDCVKWKYEKREFGFIDNEDGKRYDIGIPELRKGFCALMAKYPAGFPKMPEENDWESWEDWLCQADADVVDALVQCAIFGEIIYG